MRELKCGYRRPPLRPQINITLLLTLDDFGNAGRHRSYAGGKIVFRHVELAHRIMAGHNLEAALQRLLDRGGFRAHRAEHRDGCAEVDDFDIGAGGAEYLLQIMRIGDGGLDFVFVANADDDVVMFLAGSLRRGVLLFVRSGEYRRDCQAKNNGGADAEKQRYNHSIIQY